MEQVKRDWIIKCGMFYGWYIPCNKHTEEIRKGEFVKDVSPVL